MFSFRNIVIYYDNYVHKT